MIDFRRFLDTEHQQARDDGIKSLPDPTYGTTEHVEPGFWASFVTENELSKSGREAASTVRLRMKKPIREPVPRKEINGNYSFRS